MQHGTSTSTSPRTAWYIFRANNLRLFLEKSAHWPSGPRCLNTIKGLCDGLPHCPCWLTGLVDSDLPCFRIGASVDRCRANAHSGHGSLHKGHVVLCAGTASLGANTRYRHLESAELPTLEYPSSPSSTGNSTISSIMKFLSVPYFRI